MTTLEVYALLKKKIDNINIDEAEIQRVLNRYLNEHPEYIGATDRQAAQIEWNEENVNFLLNNLLSLGNGNLKEIVVTEKEFKTGFNIYKKDVRIGDRILIEVPSFKPAGRYESPRCFIICMNQPGEASPHTETIRSGQTYEITVDEYFQFVYVQKDPMSDNMLRFAIHYTPKINLFDTDTTLTKEGVAADAKAAGDLIVISNEEPTSESTKLWIKNNADIVQIPTMEEFNELKEKVDNMLNLAEEEF